MKTRPPKSRQASTQPLRMTVWPAWSVVKSPQVCVRFSMVVASGVGASVGSFGESARIPAGSP